MKVLFTGASSFTGFWFIKKLANAGYQVFTTYTKANSSEYEGARKERVKMLADLSEQVFNCQFGSPKFIELIKSENNWDLLCHHAAEVTNYKSNDFDFINALNKNTFNIAQVFECLLKQNCKKVLLTGSIFENNEGKGSDDLRAFSLYGLSKGLTYTVFQYYSKLFNIQLGKFVIPNPFGPFEEPRFTTYLIKTWMNQKVGSVNSPEYIRDNIHISLLCEVYLYFINEMMKSKNSLLKINPSGYPESQGKFAMRFANEMRKRFALPCELKLQEQKEFPEPQIRINSEKASELIKDWNEDNAWDELAEYYKNNIKS